MPELIDARLADLEAQMLRIPDAHRFAVLDLISEHRALLTENARLSDAWFADETIAPDGELRPLLSNTLARLDALETENARLRRIEQAAREWARALDAANDPPPTREQEDEIVRAVRDSYERLRAALAEGSGE